MLSIYLLVQKNSSKLENLLLIGYSPNNVAKPYQVLTIALNIVVLIIAWIILFFLRDYYMGFMKPSSLISTRAPCSQPSPWSVPVPDSFYPEHRSHPSQGNEHLAAKGVRCVKSSLPFQAIPSPVIKAQSPLLAPKTISKPRYK